MKKSGEQLKAALMNEMEKSIERVLAWQESHQMFTITELEDFILEIRGEWGTEVAELLAGQLESKQPAARQRCGRCGEALQYKGQSAKHIESRVGGLRVERGRYWCETCQQGLFPPG